MSTYWYFECIDHSPPLQSVEEISQSTDDHHFKHAVQLAQSRPSVDWNVEIDHAVDRHFDANARRFLIAHPVCPIGLVSEYGVRRTLEPLYGTAEGTGPAELTG